MNTSSQTSKILATINTLVLPPHANGTLLIAANNEAIYEHHFGFADREAKIPTAGTTQYLTGSVTKQFTAVALLKALYEQAQKTKLPDNQLANQIKSALQKTIASYLPKRHEVWAGHMPTWAETVTLHQLLVHSSGIPNYTSLPNFTEQKFLNAKDIITFFKTQPLEFIPGSKFSYSNSGYFLLGVIISQITGQELNIYMQQALFAPLQMHSSFLATQGTAAELRKSDARFANLALGYTFDIATQEPQIQEVNNYVDMLVPGAAGALISTAADLLKWNNALYAGKIIPKFLVELMLQSHIATEQANEFYGYGIEIKNAAAVGKYYMHGGGIPGFQSRLTFIPQQQMSIIILNNVCGDWDRLLPEIETIKSELPADLSEYEKGVQVNKIIENRYPSIVANKQRYLLTFLEASIIAEV